jgi:general secretion pathway protein B
VWAPNVSYILDALKKSEAERNRGVAPSLFAGRQDQTKSRVGPWVLFVAILINACFAGYWFYTRNDTATPNEARVVATPEPLPQTQPQPIPEPMASEQPVAGARPTAPPIATATVPTIIAPSPARLPPDVVARPVAPPRPTTNEMELANLSFSTHFYASDPTKRAVTLNGRRMMEGDSISRGVVLKEITETGVILDVNGREVPLEVLQEWR